MNKSIVLSVVFAMAFSICFSANSSWNLVWSDEFDYTGLPNSQKWGYDVGGGGYGNNELEYYTDGRIENASVANGVLTITARKESFGGNDYTSARMVTKNKGDWLYGRIEVAAKLPYGRGLWPAIWMLPTDWEYGGWPASGEIDLMENVGYDPDWVHFNIHTEAYNHTIGTNKGDKATLTDLHENFHVYALEWFEDHMDFYLDDQKVFTFVNEGTGYDVWPFDKRFHLILNVAVGGDWGGVQGIDDSAFPSSMIVDYVRVYEQNAAGPFTLQTSSTSGGHIEVTPVMTEYPKGTVVSVKAIPESGNSFLGWNGVYSTEADSFSLTMNNNVNLSSNFGAEGELLKNGDFTLGMNPWTLNSYSGDSAFGSVVNGEYEISPKNIQSVDWHIQFNQAGLTFEQGEDYILTLKARASVNRNVTVSFNQNADPWASYKKDTLALTTQMQSFEIPFTMQSVTDANSRIEFDLAESLGDVFLDDISLVKVSETTTRFKIRPDASLRKMNSTANLYFSNAGIIELLSSETRYNSAYTLAGEKIRSTQRGSHLQLAKNYTGMILLK